jgi:hypothetical protein
MTLLGSTCKSRRERDRVERAAKADGMKAGPGSHQQVDQARADFALIEEHLEFLTGQLNSNGLIAHA